jgi:hypothetical protein
MAGEKQFANFVNHYLAGIAKYNAVSTTDFFIKKIIIGRFVTLDRTENIFYSLKSQRDSHDGS